MNGITNAALRPVKRKRDLSARSAGGQRMSAGLTELGGRPYTAVLIGSFTPPFVSAMLWRVFPRRRASPQRTDERRGLELPRFLAHQTGAAATSTLQGWSQTVLSNGLFHMNHVT